MASQDTKISFLLNGGCDEQQTEELKAPIVQQGSSPTLAASRNTRLSRLRGTCVRAPGITEALALGTTVYGIIPEARSKRTAVLATPSNCSRVIADDGASSTGAGTLTANDIYSTSATPTRQNSYVPAHITTAGSLGSVDAIGNIANTYDSTTGLVWYAWVGPSRSDVTTKRLYVAAFGTDGSVALSPTVCDASVILGLTVKVGITAHGANGVRVWYQDAADLWVKQLSITGNKLTPSTPVVAVTGEKGGFCAAAQDSTYAYVAASGKLYKYNVAANTKTSVTVDVLGVSDLDDASVAVLPVSGGYRIAVAFARYYGANLVAYGLYNDSLSPLWTPELQDRITHSVSCHFLVNGGLSLNNAVFAAHDSGTGFPAGPTVTLYSKPMGGGSTSSTVIYSANLQSRGGQFTINVNETYPLLHAARGYSEVEVDNFNYVDDASSELWLMSSVTSTTPVARFGTIRGILAPAHTVYYGEEPLAACPLAVNGNTLWAAYRKTAFTAIEPGSTALSGRYVGVTFDPEQPSVAQDKDGVAFASGALPVQWDGSELAEIGGPLHRPNLHTPSVAGSWPAGIYQIAVTYEWVDAAGLKHRSRPKLSGSLTLDGSHAIQVKVATPDGFRNGVTQPQANICVYVSVANAPATMYLDRTVAVSSGSGIVTFNPDPGDSSQPQLYSTGGTPGEELTPQPPPPLRDIAIVGSRLWGVDAELPTRLVHSKLRIAGVGFEFNPALEVVLPSGAGNVLAVREMTGTVAVFAERGVFQIADGGPNNAGQGGSFGSPYKLSDVGCASRLSVIPTPVGIAFLNTRGQFCLMSGAGVQVIPGMEIDPETQSVAGAFTLIDGDEVCWVVGTTVKVFNYALQRWATWDLDTTPSLVSPSAISRDAVMLCQNTVLNLLSSGTYSGSANMSWETDWILLGGDFQDHVLLRLVIFTGRRISAHGVTVSVYTNYETTPSTTATYSASEIATLADASGRYQVKVEPSRQDTRAVKIAITETDASGSPRVGMRPLSVTLVSALEAMVHEEGFHDGAFKGG